MSLTLADSVYVVPVTTALGFSRTQFTLVFSIRSIVQLAGNLLYGKLYSRFGVKPLMVIGTLCMIFGYLLYSVSASLWMFYLAAVLVGVATSLMAASSLTIVVNSWFDKSAGLVFGVIFTGSSIGGSILSSTMGKAIEAMGYANSYRITALLAAVSAVPVLLLAFERKQNENRQQTQTVESSLSFGNFLKKKVVQTGLVLCFVIGLTIYPMEASISAHLSDRGFSGEFGAGILGASLLISALGKVLLGAIYDRFGLNRTVLAGTVCFVLGAALFIWMDSVWLAWVFAFVFGLSIANITTLSPFLAKTILRPEDYGKYIGIFTAVTAAGNTVGFAVMSSVFDSFGSYTVTVLAQIALAIGAAILFCRSHSLRNMESEACYDNTENR